MAAVTAAITTIGRMSFCIDESYHHHVKPARVKAARRVSHQTRPHHYPAPDWHSAHTAILHTAVLCINAGADPLVRAGPPGPASRRLQSTVPKRSSRGFAPHGTPRAIPRPMLRAAVLIFAATPLFGQTAAGMLATPRWHRLGGAAFRRLHPAHSRPDRHLRHRAVDPSLQRYARRGDPRVVLLRLRRASARWPACASMCVPSTNRRGLPPRLLPALQRLLTARFGVPTHEPEMMEIGFRHLRFAEPVAGDHWKGGGLHYFLHANLSASSPDGHSPRRPAHRYQRSLV